MDPTVSVVTTQFCFGLETSHRQYVASKPGSIPMKLYKTGGQHASCSFQGIKQKAF